MGSGLDWPEGDFPTCKSPVPNSAVEVNSDSHRQFRWANGYLNTDQGDAQFVARWRAVTGSWDNKIVVDIGCGSGQLYAVMGGTPQLVIAVDNNRTALEQAQKIGYTPLLAEAHHIPLTSGFADIVALNSVLHHSKYPRKALAEAARLVRPGGILVMDYDPQLRTWDYKGQGKLLYAILSPLSEQITSLHPETETNRVTPETDYQPAMGMTLDFYCDVLEPMGFKVKLYPHES